MKLLQLAGRLAYWCGWPAFWVYFRFDHGRTRVIVRQGDQILLVKQWIGDGRWQLPGGGLHKGESPVVGAVRELREETGITLTKDELTLLGEAVYRSRGLTSTMHVFKTHVDSADVRLQHHEIAAAVWLPLSQLTARNTRSDVLTALQMLQ
jgi:8-oxo-dGTP pyrophosphatase MutT (NUDIX family)